MLTRTQKDVLTVVEFSLENLEESLEDHDPAKADIRAALRLLDRAARR